MRIFVKPFSANRMWMAKKVKTKEYRDFEKWMEKLPDLPIPNLERIKLEYMVWFATDRSDLDNTQKPFIDALQARYGFNDNRVRKLITIKRVAKERVGYSFKISEYTEEEEMRDDLQFVRDTLSTVQEFFTNYLEMQDDYGAEDIKELVDDTILTVDGAIERWTKEAQDDSDTDS